MRLQESGEMYLETIYILSQKSNYVHSIHIAEYMNLSKPSVSRAMARLKEGGYLTIDSDHHIHLTALGHKIASKLYERHTLMTKVLVSIGVSEEVAAQDACKMEHILSDETFDAIKKHIHENSSTKQIQ